MARLAVVIVVLLLSGCGITAPYRATTLAFDASTPSTLGANPDEIDIARVAAGLLHGRLQLPFPAETTVYLYVNQATFAAGLEREGRVASAGAWEHARFAAGVAGGRGIFLRADLMASMTLLNRVALIAHELTHVSQVEMRRGGRGGPAQWMAEGHADWAKYRVIEMMGYRSYADSRREVRQSILRSATPVRYFPSLIDLARADQWADARNRLGSAATYGQAFVAVDWLIERYGTDKVHEFLRRFSLQAEPSSHWRVVFPQGFPDTVREFRQYLERLTD